jgi:hypothetical protein
MVDLWAGRLPLSRAFWEYAVLYGAIASFAATSAALGVLSLGAPASLALAVHLLPSPYFVATVVGVSRSAARYTGPPVWARSAEYTVVIWAIVMVLV